MDNLDRVLESEEMLVPSSGFAGSVMRRVRDEAAAPPPIPFPWKRVIPGMAVAAGVLGWAAVQGFEAVKNGLGSVTVPEFQIPAWLPWNPQQAGWVAVGLAIALVSWAGTRRLAGRR